MEKKIEELKRENPWIEKEMKLNFPEYQVDRKVFTRLRDISKSFDSKLVLDRMNLTIETKDRISIMGENGVGKTTLLNILTRKIEPDSGDLYLNSSVKVGYISQKLEGFYKNGVFLDNFLDMGYDETEIRQFLGSAKLRGEKVLQSIDTLSYGELMRGALVRTILKKAEFLILDEPTTHLDIESLEVLEGLLKGFCGGFIIVSHDRRLIANISDEIYHLREGRLVKL